MNTLVNMNDVLLYMMKTVYKGKYMMRKTIDKIFYLFKQRMPYILILFIIYTILKYMKQKQYKIYYKQTVDNERVVEYIKQMISKYQPPIHIPNIVRLIYNSRDVCIRVIHRMIRSNIIEERYSRCLMVKIST